MPIRRLALSAMAALGLVAGASAASAATSFAGKTVTIVVGLSAGGNYDFYARFLSEFYGKHLPGEPSVIVQNRTGAGSVTAANYLYGVAPKDGTTIAMTLDTLPLYQALRGKGIRFDLTKVQWIGNMAELNGAISVWHTAPATDIEGMKRAEVIMGSTGRSSGTFMLPALMNGVLGTKFKIVLGFPGTNEVNLAIERGEVHGRAGGSWDNLRVQKADWVRDRKIIPVAQAGFTRDPLIPDTPLLTEIATTPDQRKLMALLSSASVFSRAVYAPPETPADVVATLRRAFDATMKDPALVAAAEKRQIQISPQTGEDLQKLIAETLDLAPNLVDQARDILGITD
ncbi:MAG: Bug family tripartite tricarboxylate transporter substrate binding protein [Rhodospirillales bacterium]